MTLDFAYVGTARAGSTWLYHCLKAHPEICISEKKELGILTDDHELNTASLRRNFSHCEPGQKKGILPVNYLLDPGAPDALKRIFPELRVIIFLRDPVDRYWSHYQALITRGKVPARTTVHEAREKYPNIFSLGLYHDALLRFRKTFPAEQLFIRTYEDVFQDVAASLRDVYTFLGVADQDLPEAANMKINPTAQRRVRSVFAARAIARTKEMTTFLKSKSVIGRQVIGLAKTWLKADRALMTLEAKNRYGHSEMKPVQKNDVPEELGRELYRLYEEDIKKTEAILGDPSPLSRWHRYAQND